MRRMAVGEAPAFNVVGEMKGTGFPNAVLAAMLVYLASEDTTSVARERRDVFQPRPNGQPGAWPDCQQPQRSTPPLVPTPPPPPPATKP